MTEFIIKETGKAADTGIHEVSKINFYNEGEIILSLSISDLEEYKTSEKNGIKTISSVYDGKPEKIYLKNDFKRAVKENLNRKDNFYMSIKSEYSWEGKKTALYINTNEIGVIYEGEKLATVFEHEKNYLNAYTLIFKNGVDFKRSHFEKIEMENSKDYKLKEGEIFSQYGIGKDKNHACVWEYDENKTLLPPSRRKEKPTNGITKRWYETEHNEEYKMLVTSGCYCRSEYSDFRKECESIAAELTKILNKHVSHYDVERIRKIYDIVKKEGVNND